MHPLSAEFENIYSEDVDIDGKGYHSIARKFAEADCHSERPCPTDNTVT